MNFQIGIFNHFSWNVPEKKKRKNDRKKKYLLNYKSNEFKQKSTEETLPWGVTAQGINASRKLHGRGMIVCKQKENNNKQKKKKDKTTGFNVTDRLVTDVLTCFVGFLKGYHFFLVFSFFFVLFFFVLNNFSKSRYWDCWNVLGIHSTL